MKLKNSSANLFAPDGETPPQAMKRTTRLGIGAHQDDLEFMCASAIQECFQKKDQWFTGVIVTDGGGSARSRAYAKHSDASMRRVRANEQKKAAALGEYSCVISMNFSSAAIKVPKPKQLINELKTIIRNTRPDIIYTHNLADKHDTHIAVVMAVIQAARELPKSLHPKALYGCEVWRGLDWMLDQDKITRDVGSRENLIAALMGVFDSQISGGKRYDLATLGRKRANATYFDSHSVDHASLLEYFMDLTPLIKNPTLSIDDYAARFIQRFENDVRTKIRKYAV